MFKVAEQFSRFPGGRRKIHGRFSGEEFRETCALPLLEKHRFVIFDLTGSAGYSSGFLDEAFGELGLLFPLAELRERLQIISEDDPDAVDIAWSRIEDAASERAHHA
ncbi:STAS-like domain-containing protein [Luteimonas changyuni]|uniref:STAS-like domain-containing protein n=1 Tax=Luteimonas sp. MJ145 TaxID=3129234 RepID=UPI0031BADD0A